MVAAGRFRLVFASNNKGKLRELEALISPLGVEAILLSESGFTGEIDETGNSYGANAELKSRTVTRATGLPSLADDSGLEIAAMGWQPGMLSARYLPNATQEEKNAHIIAELAGKKDRRARFISVVSVTIPGSIEISRTFTGIVDGEISQVSQGENGFGYDPIFFYPPLGKTFAQLSLEEKNSVSHRAKAFRKAAAFIELYTQMMSLPGMNTPA